MSFNQPYQPLGALKYNVHNQKRLNGMNGTCGLDAEWLKLDMKLMEHNIKENISAVIRIR